MAPTASDKVPTSDLQEYIDKINRLFKDLFAHEKDYNSWETDFIQGLKERADKFKLNLLLSDKQKAKIDDLAINHLEEFDTQEELPFLDSNDPHDVF